MWAITMQDVAKKCGTSTHAIQKVPMNWWSVAHLTPGTTFEAGVLIVVPCAPHGSDNLMYLIGMAVQGSFEDSSAPQTMQPAWFDGTVTFVGGLDDAGQPIYFLRLLKSFVNLCRLMVANYKNSSSPLWHSVFCFIYYSPF